jgi:hypothetical protein
MLYIIVCLKYISFHSNSPVLKVTALKIEKRFRVSQRKHPIQITNRTSGAPGSFTIIFLQTDRTSGAERQFIVLFPAGADLKIHTGTRLNFFALASSERLDHPPGGF